MIDIPVIPPVISPFGFRIDVTANAISIDPKATNKKSNTLLLKLTFFKLSPPCNLSMFLNSNIE